MAWYSVKTYYKKSCEQHEYYVQRDGTGRIKVVDGFRFCEYNVETNDDKFPQFEFTTVPGGNAARDSLDLNSIGGPNIETSELVEMFDGGCWGDNEITGIDDKAEVERLEEFLSENGAYALEDDGDWYLEDTEVWVWGPLEVTDEEGNTRIVCADEDGNMIDFETESPVVETTEVSEQELIDALEELKAEFETLMNDMPEEDELVPVVTDWYPASINPVRVGTYQVLDAEDEVKWPFPSNILAGTWDGEKWDISVSTTVVKWRGLTKESK